MYKTSIKKHLFLLPKINCRNYLTYCIHKFLIILLFTFIGTIYFIFIQSEVLKDGVSAFPVKQHTEQVTIATQPNQLTKVGINSNSSSTTLSHNVNTPNQQSIPNCIKIGVAYPSSLSLANPGLTSIVEPPIFYTVYGNNMSQLKSQLKNCAPGNYMAATNYHLNWYFKSGQLDNGTCIPTDVRVGIHVVSQYPSWNYAARTLEADTIKWNALMQSLITHEQGHTNLDIKLANDFLIELQTTKPMPCSQLINYVQTLGNQYHLKIQQANSMYDSSTGHGQTQGAYL